MDRGAWRVTVHGVAKSRTQLSIHTHTEISDKHPTFQNIWLGRELKNRVSESMWVQSLGGEDPLEKMATHSSILVWEIPWTEEPGRL